MAGEFKHALHTVTDVVGGAAGKMEAAATTSTDGFVESATHGTRYELEAAAIALHRSADEKVRQFAGIMLSEHTTAMHQLGAALEMNETHGAVAPPNAVDARRASMIKHLADAPDGSFDHTYVDQQVLALHETVTLMRTYAEGGDNPQLRSLAMGTLPVAERQLKYVKLLKVMLAD